MKKQILTLSVLLTSLFSEAQIGLSGLVSYYKFASSNSSSLSITDETANANNGVVSNGTGFYTDRNGLLNECISMGGSGNSYNYVTINGAATRTTINAISNYTIALWYKKEDATGTTVKPILDIEDASGKNYLLEYDVVNNKVQWSHYNGTTTSTPIVSSTLTTATWYHLAFTINTTTSTAILYVNGTNQGTSTAAITTPSNPGIFLAKNPGSTVPNFPASFDDLYIYNRVLTANEIARVKDYCATAKPTGSGASRCGAGTLNLSASGGTTYTWYADSTTSTSLYTGSAYITPSISTNDTLYVSNTSGCESKRTQVIAIIKPNPIPGALVGGTGHTVDAGSTVIYSTSGITGSTYSWNVTGGTGSSTTNQVTVVWGSGSTGSVAYTITNPNGCSLSPGGSSLTINAVNNTTAIMDMTSELSKATVVYPNPSYGSFSINCPEKIMEVTLINSLGQKETFTSNEIQSSFTGLVILEVKTEKGSIYKKVECK